jgi:hypothetical protein
MHEAVKGTVEGFLAAADAALPSGYSALLFGSGARGDYVRGRSDVNLLVVTDTADFAVLRALGPALRKWQDASYEPPFLFTRTEWQRATDVYPVEITDMQARYQLLRGADPIAGVTVNPTDLRQALESELRGKLMRLRQGYATFADAERDLTPLAASSVSSILVLFRGMLVLVGDAGSAREENPAIVEAAGRAAGFAPQPVLEIVRRRDDRGWRCSAALFEGYVTAVASAARRVDQLQTGEA